jgi:hypothetical protein
LGEHTGPIQRRALDSAKHWLADEWFTRTGMRHLERASFLAPSVQLDGSSNNSSNVLTQRRRLEGNLRDRQEQLSTRVQKFGTETVQPRGLTSNGGTSPTREETPPSSPDGYQVRVPPLFSSPPPLDQKPTDSLTTV